MKFIKRDLYRDIDKDLDRLWIIVGINIVLTLLLAISVGMSLIMPSEPQNAPVSNETVFYDNYDPCGLEVIECTEEVKKKNIQ